MMTQEPCQPSLWGCKVVRAIGKVNVWLAAIGLVALALKVCGFYQMFSVVPPPFSPEDSNIVKSAFHIEAVSSGVLLFAQAYAGWGLLRRVPQTVTAGLRTFSGLGSDFLPLFR